MTMYDEVDAPPEHDHDVILSEDGPFTLIPNIIIDQFGTTLGPTGIAVYVCLKSHANRQQGMRTFVATKTIAQELGMGESTVRRDLNKMSEIGLVTRELRNNRSTIYFLRQPRYSAPSLPNSIRTLPNSGWALPNSDITIRTEPDEPNHKGEGEFSLTTAIEEKTLLHRRAIEAVYFYYVSTMGKNEKLYELTPLRRQKLLSRLTECLKKTANDVEKAVELMKCAIDSVKSNPFLMGQNTNRKKYNDLIDNIFKSYEEMEKRWNEQD